MSTFRSFWSGTISPYECLAMKSFLDFGHRYILYSYEHLDVPPGIEVADAEDILPKHRVFYYGQSAGIGRDSIAAFSNLFRYELLKRFGGWWVDTDVICLSDKQPEGDLFLGWEDDKIVGNAILRYPIDHPLGVRLRSSAEDAGTDFPWGTIGPDLLTRLVSEMGLSAQVRPARSAYPIPSTDALKLLMPFCRSEMASKIRDLPLLHTWNEVRRRAVVLPWIAPPSDSLMSHLFQRHQVPFPSGHVYEPDQIVRLNDNYLAFTHWDWHRPRIAQYEAALLAAREDLAIMRQRSNGCAPLTIDRADATNAGPALAECDPASRTEVLVIDYGPKTVALGEMFNRQPNGRSAIWIRLSEAVPESCRLDFGGQRLNTATAGTLVTAEIPQPLLDFPCVVQLRLVQADGEPLTGDVAFSIR